MSLNPQIVKDAQGVYWLKWTPDLTAEGYAITAPGGPSRTFDPTRAAAKLGRNLTEPVTASVAALDVTARQAETATYPPTGPPPPTGSYATIKDCRASKFTSIDYVNGVSVPQGVEFILSQRDDIKLVRDTRFPTWGNAAWAIRITPTSFNPGWTEQPASGTNSAEIVYEPKREIHEGQEDWFVQGLYAEALALSGNAWLIPTQYAYPKVWSAPGSPCFLGPGHWGNPTPVTQFAFITAAGITDSQGSSTSEGQQCYLCRPASEVLGHRFEWVAGVRWAISTRTGWWYLKSRIDGGPWTVHVDVKNLITMQKIASEGIRPVVDKHGGYRYPQTGTHNYLLRGVSVHPTLADAEASLAA